MQPVFFPGRQSVLSRFRAVISGGRLGQAYLFLGPEGSGKEATALEIARLVNCARPDSCRPDAPCESCRKARTFQHPDIRWIGPAPASAGESEIAELLREKTENPFHQASFAATARIVVGDPDSPGPMTVRALLRFLRMRPFQGRVKAAVVADAHRMNAAAANSFLKTLEEPPPDSLIVLLSTNRTGILPTILSRCQQVRFEPWDPEELAGVVAGISGLPEADVLPVARESDGNARRAMALLEPQAVALREWARGLVEWIHEGSEAPALTAADQLHAGEIPDEFAPDDAGGRLPAARDLAGKRERAVGLCEMLNLLYGEMLACRTRADEWRPRLAAAAAAEVRDLSARRRPETLLADIAQVEAARTAIDRNLNIGLVTAVLFQRLIDHARRDLATVRS